MIFVKKDLSEKERQGLAEALKSAGDVKWYRRLKIIELSSEGHSVPELTKMFGLSSTTIRNYIHSYNTGGLDALQYGKSTGRPRALTFLDGQWDIILRRSPSQFEKLNTTSQHWTLSLLAHFVERYYGKRVCLQTIANALNRYRARRQRRLCFLNSDTIERQYSFE